jgi:hypothetical protein
MDDEYIYESPDGGETIYRRKLNSLKRELVEISEKAQLDKDVTDWHEILEAAKDNIVLQNAIERVKMLYHLTKKDVDA